ncbi:signal peptidase I [Marinobacterium nitratireducens]|uniref:Signal peptidase I n=1 Tax=Marinobacterium nitratireducens TaxID=518897 RepID=A0A917ZHW6_9GAMM|nr:signal peptidase I [Marinobacterium nitratireducens]GGO82444.1 signal peptidase I [Marinobacterium nitratireducens]
MNFDFALVLVVATLLTAVGWITDRFWLAPARQERIRQAGAQFAAGIPEDTMVQLNRVPGWVDLSRSLFPVLLLVLLLRSFLVEPFQIPSGSMLPTLKIGDFILVNKFHYGLRLPVLNSKIVPVSDPKAGDVVVFKYPKDPSVNYIKRVVGVPGDRIRYQNKMLFINGKPQPQELLAQLPPTSPRQLLLVENLDGVQHQVYHDVANPGIVGEWVVPDGQYFVMGDNRDNSNDSRYWGFVPDELLVGKAFAVWMHWETFFSLPSFGDVRLID